MMTFKKCSKCKKIWVDRNEFIIDKNLKLNGYQVSFEKIDNGLFLFTDMNDGCETTIAVPVKEFIDLYKGMVYNERKTGSDCCEGKCLNVDDLGVCEAECELAHIRKIIRIILDLKE